ncbi:MAG: hypothetical protein ABR536_03180 [Solirubrobacterales bacterium]
MDFNRLNTGEKIAGIAGVILLISMWLFSWFEITGVNGVDVPSGVGDAAANAWESFSLIDIIIFLTAVAAIGAALLAASEGDAGLPVAMSAVVTALGALTVLLILFRLIDPPNLEVNGVGAPSGVDVDIGRKIGVFIGLLSAAAVTYGGYMGMQEEGTSFQGERDRLRSPETR